MFTTIFLVLFILILYKFLKNNKIKLGTFVKRGVRVIRSRFGVYIYDGKQGSGKTASALGFIFENMNEDRPVYANMTSIKGINYTYFNGLQGLLELQKQGVNHCIIFYDEIFSLLDKQTKINKEVLSFLSQMRKLDIIFITTCQEWLELPITLRRYCRFQIKCKIITPPLLSSLLVKQFNNAELMKFDKDENEYIAPLITNTISKLNYYLLNSYDTYEVINPNENVMPININEYRKLNNIPLEDYFIH